MKTPDILEKREGQDMPWMKSLVSCETKMRELGYVEDFIADKHGLHTFNKSKTYKPEEVHIVNYYRFEGVSDPGDNSILYVIETNDGVKGTLVDSYGAYASDDVSKFIVQVEDIQKNIPQSNA